jgi:hypothetical protein
VDHPSRGGEVIDVAIAERDITGEDLALAGGEAHFTFPCPSIPPFRC